MIIKKDLVLFTASYPFGNGEPFLDSEITYLADYFNQVYILPQRIDHSILRSLPDNCKVITEHIENKNQIYSTPLKAYLKILPIIFYEIQKCGLDRKELIYKISHLKSLYRRAECINTWITSLNLKNAIYYSYWLADASTILYFIGKKRKGFRFLSRIHGFDLFEERYSKNHIPYRKFQFKYALKIYSVSKMGMQYLKDAYPRLNAKFDSAYLGSDDFGENLMSSNETFFQLVSCSSMIDLKRIHLIVKLLSRLDLQIYWIHFGDGPLREELEQDVKSLPDNISVEFKGFVPNTELISFYKENFVDLFINVSETEGLPYSIMEAMSFGIPTMATNVGGVGEIVNSNTGILIDKNFDINETALLLSKYLQNYSKNEKYRLNIRRQWEKYFSSSKNYTSFSKTLSES